MLGIPIETAVFDSLDNPNFNPEKATAKIKCSPGKGCILIFSCKTVLIENFTQPMLK
jgi:hypothetical protein